MYSKNSSPHHSFDICLAQQYGIHEALLIHHFQHWIRVNQKLNRNFKEGKHWTYQTQREMQAHFPYLSLEGIKYALEKLIEQGILMRKNLNKSPIDKTWWYAFVDEERFVNSKNIYDTENSVSTRKIPAPIPDTNTPHPSKETHTKESQEVASLCEFFFDESKKMRPELVFKKPSKSLCGAFEGLAVTRTRQSIRDTILWALKHEFWSTRVTSLKAMYDNFVKIEAQKASEGIKNAPGSTIEKNISLATAWKEKANIGKIKGFVEILGSYVEVGRIGETHPDCISYSDPNFQNLIEQAIRKRQ